MDKNEKWYRAAAGSRSPGSRHLPCWLLAWVIDLDAKRYGNMKTSAATSLVAVHQPFIKQTMWLLVYRAILQPLRIALWRANLIAGIPFVLIVQDLWPDSIFATGYMQEKIRVGWPKRR